MSESEQACWAMKAVSYDEDEKKGVGSVYGCEWVSVMASKSDESYHHRTPF